MFIVHESKQNRLKPHRGGMVASGAIHAAPMELERILGCAVTINMSLLRSWRWIGQGRKAAPEWPNPLPPADSSGLARNGALGLGKSGCMPPASRRSYQCE
jgi:hypothetical protein